MLTGNLAPDGCIVKTAGVPEHQWEFSGPAKVAESQEEAVDLILGDGFKFVPVPPPAADRVTLNVYNTTFKSGLSGTVAAELQQRGFKIAKTGNDPGGGFFPDDTAIIRYGEHGEPAARRVQLSVKGARLVKDGRKDETVDLLLGSKFEDLVPAAQATPTIEPTATRPPGC